MLIRIFYAVRILIYAERGRGFRSGVHRRPILYASELKMLIRIFYARSNPLLWRRERIRSGVFGPYHARAKNAHTHFYARSNPLFMAEREDSNPR